MTSTYNKQDNVLVEQPEKEFYLTKLRRLPCAPNSWEDKQILVEGVDYSVKRGKQIHTTDMQQWQEMSSTEKDEYFEMVAIPICKSKNDLDGEIRMILSHAFLGCDTSDISKETWDLAISELVKLFTEIHKK